MCAGVGCVALWGDGRIDRGALRAPTPAGANPSYVLAGPADTHGTRVLYVANEFTRGDVAGGGDEPGVRALEVVQDADGATLRPLGAPVPTGGDLPCHVALGAGGGVLCVSHYGVGGVAGVEVCGRAKVHAHADTRVRARARAHVNSSTPTNARTRTRAHTRTHARMRAC